MLLSAYHVLRASEVVFFPFDILVLISPYYESSCRDMCFIPSGLSETELLSH